MRSIPFCYLTAILVLFVGCSERLDPLQPSDSRPLSSGAPPQLAVATAGNSTSNHGRVMHLLTGSAVHTPDFGPLGHATYRETIAATLYEDGTAEGRSIIDGDFSGYGLGLARFTTTIDCLSVEGNRAWYTGTVTETNNSALAPVGTAALGLFVDNGRVDQVHSGPLVAFAAPESTCRNHPSLPLFPTSNGTYSVR